MNANNISNLLIDVRICIRQLNQLYKNILIIQYSQDESSRCEIRTLLHDIDNISNNLKKILGFYNRLSDENLIPSLSKYRVDELYKPHINNIIWMLFSNESVGDTIKGFPNYSCISINSDGASKTLPVKDLCKVNYANLSDAEFNPQISYLEISPKSDATHNTKCFIHNFKIGRLQLKETAGYTSFILFISISAENTLPAVILLKIHDTYIKLGKVDVSHSRRLVSLKIEGPEILSSLKSNKSGISIQIEVWEPSRLTVPMYIYDMHLVGCIDA